MKKRAVLFFIVVFLIHGCAQPEIRPEIQSISDDEKTAEERLAKGNYKDTTTDHMVASEYSSLEWSLDTLINAGNMIGPRHYDELEAAVNKLERDGEDVSILREKLSRLIVAPRQDSEGGRIEEQHAVLEDNSGKSEGMENKFRTGLLSPRGCEGTGSRMLGASPLALQDLQKILPMGIMSSVHITPTDHQYWHTLGYFGPSDDKTNLDRFKVYAPADGYIVEIGIVPDHGDYRVIIEHSCNFYTIFIHIDKLADKIISSVRKEDGDVKTQAWPRIFVREGEVIGSIGIGKFDFSVIDESVTLQGFVNPQTYQGEVWKIHTADTFDYYSEPLKSQLLEKNVRNVEPLGGKIDYDIDGRLIGNWFQEGTNGYRGLGNWNYWTSHLSIVYDALDPSHIEVSIGDFDGDARQYGVKGNAPKPEDIGIEDGIVKYELVPYDHYSSNKKWDGIEFAKDFEAINTDEVRGVAVFQLIDDRKMKAEFFPNKKASQVTDFTNAAVIYER